MNKLPIKWTLALIAMLMLALLSSCFVVDADDDAEEKDEIATEAFQYTVSTMGKQHLKLANVNGSIIVRGDVDIDSVYIEGRRIVKAVDEDDAENGLARLRVDIQTLGNALNVESIHPKSNNGITYQIDYEITIPKNWAVTISNVNGRVNVKTIENAVVIGLVNGDVILDNISGNVQSGVTNGIIACDMSLVDQGTCVLSTVNGNVALEVPKSTSATLSAGVVNGSVSVSQLTISELQQQNKRVEGKLGAGRGAIQLSAVNGNISVTGK